MSAFFDTLSADSKSLQDTYAPHNACFGCGPSNLQGLRLKSFVDGDVFRARWTPLKMHEAFEGVLNGGVIGALLDCHCNWAAAEHLRKSAHVASPPCTVTASYSIVLKRPCPTDGAVELESKVTASMDDRCEVSGLLFQSGVLRATCTGLFVAVKEGHPAFHRW
jgi:acyl-coenzyme A thioesterase PaaI-like protein